MLGRTLRRDRRTSDGAALEGALSRLFPLLLLTPLLAGCGGDDGVTPPDDEPPVVDRLAAIPADALKGTPQNDPSPPILHSSEFEEPVSLPVISTAGAEDAPFFAADRQELYFFFAADPRQDASLQLRDPVNGIWVSRRVGGTYQEPTLVWLQEYSRLALNGCPWVGGDLMLFCSAREGYAGLGWFSADFRSGAWTNWQPETFPAELEVGELHIHGDEMYYGSTVAGGAGANDIWRARRTESGWGEAVNVAVVNSSADESRPFVTADGQELWITRWYQGTPAIYRSKKVAGEWQAPELIVSRFAGEPTLDLEGNLYFVHHFYIGGVARDVDIYVAYRK